MPAKILISENDRKLIQKFYEEECLFSTEIGQKLGLTRTVVGRVLKELKIESRGTSKPIPVGTEFNNGQLKVTAPAPDTVGATGWRRTNVWVHCKCNGPNADFVVAAYLLRCGNVKSCGCICLNSPNYKPHPDREWGRIQRIYLNNRPDFVLSLKQVQYICSLPCFYCGSPCCNELKGRRYRVSTGKVVLQYSGIDEVVHGKGHIVGNVLPCCIVCNKAKSDMSLEEWCRYAHTNAENVLEAARTIGNALVISIL